MRTCSMPLLLSRILLVVVCVALGGPARADIPNPNRCTVVGAISQWGVLVAPGPLAGTTLTITARNGDNIPVPYAIAQVVFNQAIRVCGNAPLMATCDVQGVCEIQLRAGGCLRNTIGACVVTVNGIEIVNYRDVKSPDNAGHEGSAPDGSVAISDLAYFADEFLGAAAAACHDYDNDGACDIADMPFFGDSFTAGMFCTP
jgi:hypothetical protein